MIKSIQHLRGDENEWKNHDIVVPDGELAILRTRGGSLKIKIGDGEHPFSELGSLLGDAVTSSDNKSITMMHAKSYRLGEAPSIKISFPETIDDDYYSELSFDSGKDATEFEILGSVRLSGDGVADEELMPLPNTHYTVFIWYDGSLQGIVRGLPNA